MKDFSYGRKPVEAEKKYKKPVCRRQKNAICHTQICFITLFSAQKAGRH